MKTLSCLASAIISACVAFGTAQEPDFLIIDGDTFELNSNPLERYLETHEGLRPKGGGMMSSLWRGYVAYFEIAQGKMTVKEIMVYEAVEPESYSLKQISVLDSVFPEGTSRSADWFSGILILPLREQLRYVHMGYASIYERYRLLYLKDGRVVADAVFVKEDYLEYKRRQFEVFKTTERFNKVVADLRARFQKEDLIDLEGFLFVVDTQFPEEIILDFKDFRPNQPAEPTGTSVTDRADARSAPAAPVAHQ